MRWIVSGGEIWLVIGWHCLGMLACGLQERRGDHTVKRSRCLFAKLFH